MKFLLTLLSSIFITSIGAQIQIDESDPKRPIFSVPMDDKLNTTETSYSSHIEVFSCKTDGSIGTFTLAGNYTVKSKFITFQPLFPLSDSLDFLVKLVDTSFYYHIPKQDLKKTVNVVQTYPSDITIPENILCFYVEFDQPMIADPIAYKQVQLKDAKGEFVSSPWRQRSYWINGDRTLVLMIHPGRVKNGIHSTYGLTPIFTLNNVITLQIGSGLRSKKGGILAETVNVSYDIIAKDTISPKLLNEALNSPRIGTKDPLTISFTEPMDYGLIHKWLKINDEQQEVQGQLTSIDAKNWFFTPAQIWSEGFYELELANKISDVCHNQLDRLFEVKLKEEIRPNNNYTFPIKLTQE